MLALCAACGVRSNARGRQVIVIGVDGMDPQFVERHWADLPNLSRLRDSGSFTRLATTTPPQSPVAWSTFSTGLDPDQHGIFDFVHRDPATMEPFLSIGETRPGRFNIPLGPYTLPLEGPRVVSLRKGETFWQALAGHGIPVTMIRMPANYPPVQAGEALAGMGTPDLRGTQGTFTFYTDDPGVAAGDVAGGQIVRVELTGGHAQLSLEGPPNSLRKDGKPASAILDVDVDPDRPYARISIAGKIAAILGEGEWSAWLPAEFVLIPHLASVHGMVRLFARQLHPRFELYVSPVNIDPLSPDLPISAPASFSRDVARRVGRFSTLGIPEDTSALRQGIFDLPEFLSQSRLILAEERKLLDDTLTRFHEGFLFFYFSSVDQNSHILWGTYEPDLLAFYRAVDDAIGQTRQRMPRADLIVMSDHGFAPFTRAVNLNTWLYAQGWLALKTPLRDDTALAGVDWTRTKAYAMGLNALYINLAGRERHGIVQPAERDRVIARIRERLLALRDPQDNALVVKTVSRTGSGPDLIVGYARGYRASWQTGVGGFGSSVLEDNTDPWIGDHCIDAGEVPGVLFTTRKVAVPAPSLKDLPVTILGQFGLPPATGMTGRSVY